MTSFFKKVQDEYQRACEQTQIDHVEYAKKVRNMSMAELLYVIKDCKKAIAAMPEGHKAGYYADEINYCASEIYRRKNSKEG